MTRQEKKKPFDSVSLIRELQVKGLTDLEQSVVVDFEYRKYMGDTDAEALNFVYFRYRKEGLDAYDAARKKLSGV